MVGIVIFGLVCVVCTIVIGLCVTKRLKDRQPCIASKEEHLIRIKSDSVNGSQNESEDSNGSVEMNKIELNVIIKSLSDDTVDELFEIYQTSKPEFMERCELLGLSDECVEELFALFERFKTI